LFAKDMAARKSGKIMNVASLLSFLPFPYYSVYSATKSFVLAFTETVAAELEDSGITVTALCPGPVDTRFQTDEMKETNANKTTKLVSATIVAKAGVKLLLNGKGKKIVGFQNWFISNLPRVMPDVMMMKIKKKLASVKS
jgi:short-subunit dehydrogenase